MTKRAVLYSRVSTGDQHLETQLLDLRDLAKQRGLEVVREYSDVISGAKSKSAPHKLHRAGRICGFEMALEI